MRRFFHGLAVVIVLGMIAAVQAQQTVLEVIDLKYRNAEQIVPLLKPLLAPGGTISALQNRVIVRTTPQNLAELRKVLDAVDTRPKRLVISVRQEAAGTALATEAEVSGSVGKDGARVTVPDSGSQQGATAQVRRGDSVAQARVFSSQSAATNHGVQTVQVLEGNEAFITTGQSVPLPSGNVIPTPPSVQLSESVEYRDAVTGFRVRPRIHGDRVTLEIRSRRDTVADRSTGTFEVQHIDTVIYGRLGEWMEIGGVDQSHVQTDNGAIFRRSRNNADDRKVLVKVEHLP